ncbi:hypothetical protein DPC56_05165 [Methanothermobacter tenebrarum]|uniref:Uncharacterized protein n=1 Tax=Methanothermobacter tenebrarum TaxID=680118 RepID=A0A328PBH1_9EURY|nr:hypothetical protein DPC56_05165 [Methanothermobacter tenebrarum]
MRMFLECETAPHQGELGEAETMILDRKDDPITFSCLSPRFRMKESRIFTVDNERDFYGLIFWNSL